MNHCKVRGYRIEDHHKVVMAQHSIFHFLLRDLLKGQLGHIPEHLNGPLFAETPHGAEWAESHLVAELSQDGLVIERLICIGLIEDPLANVCALADELECFIIGFEFVLDLLHQCFHVDIKVLFVEAYAF